MLETLYQTTMEQNDLFFALVLVTNAHLSVLLIIILNTMQIHESPQKDPVINSPVFISNVQAGIASEACRPEFSAKGNVIWIGPVTWTSFP